MFRMLRNKQKMERCRAPVFSRVTPHFGRGIMAKALENLTATDLVEGGIESESHRLGRRLILWFQGNYKPELNRAEFRVSNNHLRHSYIQQRDNDGHSFTFGPTPKALSLFFLEYKCAGLDGREGDFFFP